MESGSRYENSVVFQAHIKEIWSHKTMPLFSNFFLFWKPMDIFQKITIYIIYVKNLSHIILNKLINVLNFSILIFDTVHIDKYNPSKKHSLGSFASFRSIKDSWDLYVLVRLIYTVKRQRQRRSNLTQSNLYFLSSAKTECLDILVMTK